jgi:hypothetical protein
MARVAQFPARFDVLEDKSLASTCESDQSSSSIDLGDTRPAPLRDIAVPSAQNRQSRQVDSLAVEFRKLHIGEPHQLDQYKGKPVTNTGSRPRSGSRSTRPPPGALETVPEDENQILSKPAAVGVSAKDQNYIELSGAQPDIPAAKFRSLCIADFPSQLASILNTHWLSPRAACRRLNNNSPNTAAVTLNGY